VDPTADPQNCGGCGRICAAGTCGVTLAASMTTGAAPLGWSFNPAAGGGAYYDTAASVAVLTDDLLWQTGTLLYQQPIAVDVFTASFDLRVSKSAAGAFADGLGFVLIRDDPTVAGIPAAVGLGGGGLGMVAPQVGASGTALTGFGVEFDTYGNDATTAGCGETVNGDHVNVDSLAWCQLSGSVVPRPLAAAQPVVLSDGAWHHVVVALGGGQLAVSMVIGGTLTPIVTGAPLPGFVPGDSYYVGFSAATGGLSARHEIRNVAITFPSARCL
jgi:hypothetical protein